jgi:Tetracyclin repressor-like, C-terminal domain
MSRVLGGRPREAGVASGGGEPWAHGIAGMVQASADWWSDRRSISRAALFAYVTGLISSGVEGMFAGAIGGDASAVPLPVHSAFP